MNRFIDFISLSQNEVIFVNFHMPNCPICDDNKIHIDKLVKNYRMALYNIDITDKKTILPQIAMSAPSYAIYYKGKELGRIAGNKTEAEFKFFIEKHLKSIGKLKI